MKRGEREGGAAGKRERVKGGGGVGKVVLGYLGLECFFLYLSFRFN
jgi:hypothetical protein